MTIPEDRYRNMYFMNPSLGMPDDELRLLEPPGELHGPCYMPDLSSVNPRRATYAPGLAVYAVRQGSEPNPEYIILSPERFNYPLDRAIDRRVPSIDWTAVRVNEPRVAEGAILSRDAFVRLYESRPRFGVNRERRMRENDELRRLAMNHVMEAMQREIMVNLLTGPEHERTVLFERELRRRVAEDRFRHAYGDRFGRPANYLPVGVDPSLMAIYAFWPGFTGFPHFEDEAAARDWYESMGVPWPEDGPTPWSHMTQAENLKTQAKTLRERAFARIFQGLTPDGAVRLHCTTRWEGCKNYELNLKGKKLRNVMAAARRDSEARKHLTAIPIADTRHSTHANDELVEPLQDLGDIIVHEITLAYEEEYYPRPVGVAALEPEHVTLVMKSMQREIDRESRGMHQVKLEEDLSWERQVSLAERRRMWFAKFGITPKSWKTGHWNLWKVSNEPFPEGYPTDTRYYLNEHGTPVEVDTANDQDDGAHQAEFERGPELTSWEEMMRQAYGVSMTNSLTGRIRMNPPQHNLGRGPFPGGRVDGIIIDNPSEGMGFLNAGDFTE